MKNLIIVFTLTLISSVSYSQTSMSFFKALKNKDTNTIQNYLSSDVDLCIGAYQDYLNKGEALTKIMEFVNKENPISFEILHNGKSTKSGSNYNVAKLVTKSGNYRIFIYFEKSNASNKISEIRFDK